jgi:hypothetical protein
MFNAVRLGTDPGVLPFLDCSPLLFSVIKAKLGGLHVDTTATTR